MDDPKLEDATVGMAEALLRLDHERPERNSVEDRTAADVLRRKGFTPERIERWFGYVPQPMPKEAREEPRRTEPAEAYGLAAFVSFAR